MARYDALMFLMAYLFFIGLVPFEHRIPDKKALKALLLILPLFFLAKLVWFWGSHLLSVTSQMDATLMYIGVPGSGTPYLSSVQIETPTYFAFMRFATNLGNGSLETYKTVVRVGSYLALVVTFLSFLFAAVHWRQSGHRQSSASVVCMLSVCIAGLLPIFRNLELVNTNIWVTGFVALYLLCAQASAKKSAHFLGGFSLGVAFMIKPYLPVVLAFLLFSNWRKRQYSQGVGLVSAGISGFLLSLLVPGIGLDTYAQFLSEVRQTIYFHRVYYVGLYLNNLSLLKYLPLHLIDKVSMLLLLSFGAAAFFLSKRPGATILPWFFVTLFPFPIMWEEHLAGIFPAFFFFVLQQNPKRQAGISAMVVCLVFFSSVIKIPLIPNALLLLLWLCDILPVLGKRDDVVSGDSQKHRITSCS